MSGQLVLASGSRARVELLSRLELAFVSDSPAEFDERALDHRFAELVRSSGSRGPQEFALLLARGKAKTVAARRPNDWILAADQIAVLDPRLGEPPTLLHKPGSEDRAVAQLMRLRGRTHTLIEAVVLARGGARELQQTHAIAEQRLTMREFDEAEARAYVARHQPLHSVGSYHIEDAGIRLFDAIEGDYTGIMGLPLIPVCRLLRGVGLL